MWFKNLVIYQLENEFTYTPESLEEKLAEKAFTPTANHEMFKMGWSSPLGKDGEMLVHAGGGAFMICSTREERILPASVIRDFMDEKIEAIEHAELRKVRKKEKDQIKDEVTLDLLPRAFTRRHRMFAMIIPSRNIMLVDASSNNKADEFTALLRETLGDTPLLIPEVNHSPVDRMTQWLTDQTSMPHDLMIGDECELQDPSDEGAIVRCRRQDLAADEIQTHLDAGKQAKKLSLNWADKINFVLAEDLSLKKVKFSDELLEQAAESEADDAYARFDADFTLMKLEFEEFLPRFADFFGGFKED